MFGYVMIDKMELKVKDYYKYKGYYCGLCMCLKYKYNEISRLSLNYDMTYMIILLSSLYESQNEITYKRCIAHPNKKQLMIQNEITNYAAAMNVVLAYYNCKDDWQDEKDIKGLAGMIAFKRAFKQAVKKYPNKAEIIQIKLKQLFVFEQQKVKDLDKVSNVFGELMGELFAYKNDHWKKYLSKIGFYLGKYIYLLDAYEDLEKDKKNNSYNPLKYIEKDNLDEYMYNIQILNLTFLQNEIDKLPLIQDKDILDNILYSGILKKFKNKGTIEEDKNERSI